LFRNHTTSKIATQQCNTCDNDNWTLLAKSKHWNFWPHAGCLSSEPLAATTRTYSFVLTNTPHLRSLLHIVSELLFSPSCLCVDFCLILQKFLLWLIMIWNNVLTWCCIMHYHETRYVITFSCTYLSSPSLSLNSYHKPHSNHCTKCMWLLHSSFVMVVIVFLWLIFVCCLTGWFTYITQSSNYNYFVAVYNSAFEVNRKISQISLSSTLVLNNNSSHSYKHMNFL
jgi:hypothetical protein